jgi:hypothetical protein
MIPFTQYLFPNGERRRIKIERPPAIERIAEQFIAAGGRFEAEMLRNLETVSLTAVHAIDGEEADVAITLCRNDEGIPDAVDKLVRGAAAWMREHDANQEETATAVGHHRGANGETQGTTGSRAGDEISAPRAKDRAADRGREMTAFKIAFASLVLCRGCDQQIPPAERDGGLRCAKCRLPTGSITTRPPPRKPTRTMARTISRSRSTSPTRQSGNA